MSHRLPRNLIKVLQSKPQAISSSSKRNATKKQKIGAELFRNLNVVGSEHKQAAQTKNNL
jgi:hypothetical protein